MGPDMERDVSELRKRFGADEWPPATGERLFVADFGFGGRELSGFRLVRASAPPVGPAAGARSVLSVWQAAAADDRDADIDALVLADVVECDSREAAADALLELLGQFQSPLVGRTEGAGEVAFAHGEGALAFLRGNLAVRLMVGGPAVDSVLGAAREFDANLVARPDLGRTRLAPDFVRPPTADAAKDRVTLDVEVRDLQERPLMLKFFTTSGSIVRVDAKPVFRPDGAGRHAIEVFAITPDGDAARTEMTVETS